MLELSKFERVLDGMLEVSVSAKRAAAKNGCVASRARTLIRMAVAGRREVRRSVEAALLGCDDDTEVSRYEQLLVGLTRRTRALLEELGSEELWFSAAEARLEIASRDARCVAWLSRQFAQSRTGKFRSARVAGLGEALLALRRIEKSPTFQRALLLDQLRLAPQGRARDALAYGTTPFASFATVLAHESCAAMRRRCYADRHVLVVGSSTGSLCLFATALGLRSVGVEVVPTLVAVAKKLAASHPQIGAHPRDFVCADARDHAALRPLVRRAAVVVLTSSCWSPDVVASVVQLLEGPDLAPAAIVVDYAPNLHHQDAHFDFLTEIRVPVSWCLDSTLPLHVYAKKLAPHATNLHASLAAIRPHEVRRRLRLRLRLLPA